MKFQEEITIIFMREAVTGDRTFYKAVNFLFFQFFLVANILFPLKEMQGKDLGFVQNFATKIDQSC